MDNYNPPAFARTQPDWEAGESPQEGMTLRDYFAAAALTGLIARHDNTLTASYLAYRWADAMLAERAKPDYVIVEEESNDE